MEGGINSDAHSSVFTAKTFFQQKGDTVNDSFSSNIMITL